MTGQSYIWFDTWDPIIMYSGKTPVLFVLYLMLIASVLCQITVSPGQTVSSTLRYKWPWNLN